MYITCTKVFFLGGGQNLHFIFTNFTQISTDACVQKKNKYEFENLCFLKCLAIKLSSCFGSRHLFDTNIRFTILKSRDRVKSDNQQKDKRGFKYIKTTVKHKFYEKSLLISGLSYVIRRLYTAHANELKKNVKSPDLFFKIKTEKTLTTFFFQCALDLI